ncbi:hypothetical protein LTS08_002413 [Lithohypha guttulata]|nr:hypothetical protein LTS08_002413 [Lithohypha guttulata]
MWTHINDKKDKKRPAPPEFDLDDHGDGPVSNVDATRSKKRKLASPSNSGKETAGTGETVMSPTTSATNTIDKESPESSKNDSQAPETTRTVTREDVLAAAFKLASKGSPPPDVSDEESEEDRYMLGPPSTRPKKRARSAKGKSKAQGSTLAATKKSGQDLNKQLSTSPTKTRSHPPSSTRSLSTTASTTITPSLTQNDTGSSSITLPPSLIGRRMTTLTYPPSSKQKLFPNHPPPDAPFPADFTLTELCQYYPNHLIAENLHHFIQYQWSASDIMSLLPSQDNVAEEDRISQVAINSRLKKMKAKLKKEGRLDRLLEDDEKEHDEGTMGEVEEQDVDEDEDEDEEQEETLAVAENEEADNGDGKDEIE